jgi:hypothetical protein
MRFPLVAATFALLLPCIAAAFDHAAYLPIELKQVAPLASQSPEGRTFQVDAAHSRYRSTVTFAGNTRRLSDDVRSLIRYWRKAMQHPQSYEDLFESEIEVMQGGQTYWMPIQRQLVAPFIAEIQSSSKVTLYVLLMGGIDRTHVFTVSAFEAEPPHQPLEPTRIDTPSRPAQLHQ